MSGTSTLGQPVTLTAVRIAGITVTRGTKTRRVPAVAGITITKTGDTP